MQHTLLGIGLLLIAAIVAALAAPLFVDWNAWRAEFEQRASALVNVRVTIKLAWREGMSRADAVEFHAVPGGGPEQPFPIEHKRGRPKRGDEDRVQLCAQALCLEEMLGKSVPTGALFYGQSRRRADVVFDDALRRRTETVAAEVRALFGAGATPPPPAVAPCKSCSLLSACQPTAFRARRRSVASWIAGRLEENDNPSDPL